MRKRLLVPVVLAGVAIAASRAGPAQDPTRPSPDATPRGCCAPHGGMMGEGRMHGMGEGRMPGGMGSLARHRVAMMGAVPAPYTQYTNPLPATSANLVQGAAVYAANCAACHGDRGRGDGPAAANLHPPPADLASLADMPMGASDAFLYWTIAEGGAPFGTAMPAFKDRLSRDDIWAVAGYLRAHLPPARDDAH